MSDSFWLIESGRFEDACTAADLEFSRTGEHAELRHKCSALFHLRRYSEVIPICEQILRDTNWRIDSDAICLGIAHWMMGNSDEAYSTLMAAKDCPYSDAAGGVEYLGVAYSMAIINHKTEIAGKILRKLSRKAKSMRVTGWPQPIALFLCSLISESELLAAVANTPYLDERQLCQGYYYAAIVRKRDGDEVGFKNSLRDCVSQKPAGYLEDEYYLAQFLLS